MDEEERERALLLMPHAKPWQRRSEGLVGRWWPRCCRIYGFTTCDCLRAMVSYLFKIYGYNVICPAKRRPLSPDARKPLSHAWDVKSGDAFAPTDSALHDWGFLLVVSLKQ